jgi:tetratricopeptide (TPR) repeat protein
VGWILSRAGRFEEALREYRKALELDPNHVWAYWQIGTANSALSRHGEAIAALETALELSGRNPAVAASLGEAYAKAGRKAEARAILEDLTALSRRRYVSPMAFVLLYVGLEDMDRVFAWMEKCYAERNNGLAYLAVLPGWERIREDPRGQDLIRRVGLGRR